MNFRRSWCPRVLLMCLAAVLLTAAAQDRGPILVLVSFDGFRADLFASTKTPNLHALAARGVRAAALIPSFPSVTFPNHYTIVTGLYPEHHGIVSNNIVDASIRDRFTMSAPTSKDPRWWGGEPLWNTAIRQGRRAAAMFWPGSEVPIGGQYPNYWKPFSDAFPNTDRVTQVIDWLALPAAEQPSFITLYFSDVDHAGHEDGPNSPAYLEAAEHLDESLGQLMAGIDRLGLRDRVTLVVVSDHGMSEVSTERQIFIDDYIDPTILDVVDWSPVLALSPRSGSLESVYAALHGKHPALSVYMRESMPERLHYRDNARIQPLIGIAADGWTITTHARARPGTHPTGAHGFDPQTPSMHALFVAAGPRLRAGVVVPALRNVDLYEFMCAMLALTPAKNDGRLDDFRRLIER